MLNIGIECESIEDQNWGIGRIVNKTLEEISQKPELAREFKFFLYFKSKIPALPYLDNPIFVKKILTPFFLPASFSLYYYVLLPIKLWFEGLDMMFFPNYMLPIFFRGKSLVILTEDIYYEMNSGILPQRYKLAYKIFTGWWAVRHATRIMAISETSKKEIGKLFKINPDRIFVNTLGIEPSKVLTTDYRLSFDKLRIPNGVEGPTTNYLLYVGQAFPRRHLRETMLAFEQIVSQTTHYSRFDRPELTVKGLLTTHLQLIAIGKDKYNPQIIEKLKNEINSRLGWDAIIYKDYVPEGELATLYTNAKLAVYISSKEAFGLPPLEALAYGVPAVIADQAVTREIFGNHAFFVVDPDNPNSIAETIINGLTNNTKRQEIKNASEGILAKYTWQKHADRFLEIIKAAH